MRLIVTLLLLTVTAPAWAEWVKFAEIDEAVVYYDPATIEGSGDIRSVWELHDLKQREDDGTLSRKYLVEYSCFGEVSAGLRIIEYSKPMGRGNVLSDDREKDPPLSPPPQFMPLLRIICANYVNTIDYGKPHRSASYTKLWSTTFVFLGLVVLSIVLPILAFLMLFGGGFGTFVLGGALGGMWAESKKSNPDYVGSALGGAAVIVLLPIALAIAGPVGIYFYIWKPIMHRLDDADRHICCFALDYRNHEFALSQDGRWFSAAGDKNDESLADFFSGFSSTSTPERKKWARVYLADVENGTMVYWPTVSGWEPHIQPQIDTDYLYPSQLAFSETNNSIEYSYIFDAHGYTKRIDLNADVTGVRNLHRSFSKPGLSKLFSLISFRSDNSLLVRDESTGRDKAFNVTGGDFATMSPDGRVVAVTGEEHIEFWDVRTTQLLKRYRIYDLPDRDRTKIILQPSMDGGIWVLYQIEGEYLKVFDLRSLVKAKQTAPSSQKTLAKVDLNGLREMTPSEYIDPNDTDWRNKSPTKFLLATADFDGDGSIDSARLLLTKDGQQLVLLVTMSGNRRVVLFNAEATYASSRGIEVIEPQVVKTACGKGYWRCEGNEPAEVVLERPAVISFVPGVGGTVLHYWSESKRIFDNVALDD